MADPVNWNMLAQYQDPGQRFAEGMQTGNALMGERAHNAYANEQMKNQREDREREQRAAKLQEAHQQITMMGRLLDSATDEASYQQARQAAQGLGMDLSQVPPNFDPNWISQAKMQARALTGDLERELMAVAPGTAVLDKRTGQQVFKNPDRPRLIPTQPGGGIYNADEGGWEVQPHDLSGGGSFAPSGSTPTGMPHTDINTGETTAYNPETGETLRYNPQASQWESVGGAGQRGPRMFP